MGLRAQSACLRTREKGGKEGKEDPFRKDYVSATAWKIGRHPREKAAFLLETLMCSLACRYRIERIVRVSADFA